MTQRQRDALVLCAAVAMLSAALTGLCALVGWWAAAAWLLTPLLAAVLVGCALAAGLGLHTELRRRLDRRNAR